MKISVDTQVNTAAAEAKFKALTAQVAALNAELARSSMIPAGGSPQGFKDVARGAKYAANAYDAALASSGHFRVEQLRINDAVAKNTELLQKQKLGFREVFGRKNRTLMRSMYHEQLAMQQAWGRMQSGNISKGKQEMSLAVPTAVDKSWDSLNNKVGWFRYRLASASQQLVNWGKNTQWAGRQLTAGLSMPMAAFGATAAVITYQLDTQLTRIAKVYDTTANQNSASAAEQAAAEKELAQVREEGMQTAISAAHAYGAAAQETLAVQAELAATGLKGAELQKSTSQVMRIATLGEIDHAVATKALISLQSVLGLTAKQTGDAFNYMNAIENATSLSTDDFAEAIPRALGPMKEMGGDLQDLSVLLVAMKERGIEAAQGANAIKAMMQRLYRPSKQVREEWVQLAKVDPLDIVQRSGGDIMKILPELSKAVEGMARPARVKLLAGLFGTYQVTRMDAMLEGIDAMNKGLGQTNRVLEVNQMGWEKWGDIAENELKQRTESISGQFKIALESLKVEMAEVGEPFLKIATYFLKATTAAMKFFNSMPGWVKNTAAVVAIGAALLGPIVMLVGLFANFAGILGRVAASILKVFSNLELLNKSQFAARIQAKYAESEMEKQAAVASTLTQRIETLTMAVNEYSRAMYQAQGIKLPVHLQQPLQVQPGMLPSSSMPAHNDSRVLLGMPGGSTANVPTGPSSAIFGLPKEERVAAIRAQADEMRKVEQSQHIVNQQALAEQKVREKTARVVNGTSLATAAMAGSMLLMVGTSNDVANNIGKWLMIATVILPAVQMLGPAMVRVATAAKGAVAAQIAARAASAGMVGNTLKTAGAMGTMRGALMGARAGALAIMGPLGWAATAAAAIGIGFYAYHKHQQAIISEEAKAHEDLINAAEKWNEVMGKVTGHYKTITTLAPKVRDTQDVNAAYEAYTTGDLKDVGESFKGLDDAEDRAKQASQIFLDLQVKSGMSAKQAANNIRALYLSAGASITEADVAVRQIIADMTEAGKVDWGKAVANQAEILKDALDFAGQNPGNDDAQNTAEEAGKQFAEMWSNGFEEADMGDAANKMMDQLESVAQSRWSMLLKAMQDDPFVSKLLSDYDIKTAGDLSKFYQQQGDAARGIFMEYDPTGGTTWDDMAGVAMEVENAIIGSVAETNKWGDGVKTVNDVLGQASVKAKTFTLTGAIADASQLAASLKAAKAMNSLGLMSDEAYELQRATAEATINTYNLEHGFKQGKTVAQALRFLVNGVKDDTDAAAGSAEDLANELKSIPTSIDVNIKIDQIGGIIQSGMSGVMDDIASGAENTFNTHMQNAIDAQQSMWDNRQSALQAQQDRAQDAFDARWDRRKKAVEDYYDAQKKAVEDQIEAEQKAEELRQKIFEAEMTRLDRLAEAQNQTIDFNVALQSGDLDEAAKLRNDMEASAAQWALSDAAGQSGTRSERRIDRLENKGDRIDDRRDKAMERLEKQEKAERAHLERVQKMREQALQEQADAAMAAYQAEWDARKENLNAQLELFKSFVPKNQKELKVWMEQMRSEFDLFGNNTLDPMSQKWGRFFQTSFQSHIREAGAKVASDNMWAEWGNKQAMGLLRGFGFSSLSKFENFIRTGNLPKDFGKVKPKDQPATYAGGTGTNKFEGDPQFSVHHRGGMVGEGGSGRHGVARTLKGLHSSEQMVLAQKGEYIWDRKTTKNHYDVIEGIQNGVYDPINGRPEKAQKGVMGGATGIGFSGLLAAAVGRMFALGMANSLSQSYSKAQNRYAQTYSGAFGTAKAGKYGDITFDAEQLKNANIIANVGKRMGMSARDIEIGIMTAITESGLRNVNYGDRDSLGLFQQRPSMGWGTVAQVTNPEYAASKFFSVLKGVAERGNMSPWMAAQTVQRSAYSDGSNYQQYWNEAEAIFDALKAQPTGGVGGAYVPGPGGRHRPINGYGYGGIHDEYTGYPAVDFAAPVGTSIYAVADGRISRSYDITGYEPRNAVQNGYRSYGRVMYLKTDAGPEVLYAHLSQRGLAAGARVKGGAVIGKSGNTGHSTGPHLHFGANNGPLAWLEKGGFTIGDGIAMLHDGETVMTKPLTRDLMDTVSALGNLSRKSMSWNGSAVSSAANDVKLNRMVNAVSHNNVASGGDTQYNVVVNVAETGADPDMIADAVIRKIERKEARRPQRRSSR